MFLIIDQEFDETGLVLLPSFNPTIIL